MSRVRVTRELESWAAHRQRNALARVALGVVAVVGVLAALAVVSALLLPELRLAPIALGLVALAVVVTAVVRRPLPVDPAVLASEVDQQAGSSGLLRAAIEVEANRAVGGEPERAEVRRRAEALIPKVQEIGRPALVLPVWPFVAIGASALLAALSIGLVVLQPGLPPPGSVRELPRVGAGFSDDVRRDLERSVTELDALVQEPGLDPSARAALVIAHDAARAALMKQDDAQIAAGELDRARAALLRAESGPLRSGPALAAARSSEVAQGLSDALHKGDPGSSRRLAEEVLRRVESERSEGELRRLGRQLADGEIPKGAAGDAMKRAGQQLATGDRGGALAALSDLMAALGEPVRFEPTPSTLDQAADAVERARQQAVEQLEQAEAAEQGQGAGKEGPEADGPAVAPGEGEDPSPVDLPSEGGDPDPDPLASEDPLREGQGPSPGEPTVAAEAPESDAPREERDGLADRTAAADGQATGDTLMEGEGGAGVGLAGPEGAQAGAGAGSAPTAELSASSESPGEGAGQGMGTGAELDLPLLDIEPDSVPSDWVAAQWTGAPDAMGDIVRSAEAGGRSTQEWGQVHARYRSIAETVSRRGAVPLTRRTYIQQYFEAIRPEPATETP